MTDQSDYDHDQLNACRTAAAKHQLHQNILEATNLTAQDKVVLSALLMRFHNSGTGKCNPRMEFLAKASGCGERAARASVARGEALGYVQRHQVMRANGVQSSNTYSFAGLTIGGAERAGCPGQNGTSVPGRRVTGTPVGGAERSALTSNSITVNNNHLEPPNGGTPTLFADQAKPDTQAKPPKAKPRTRMTEEWWPTDALLAYATDNGIAQDRVVRVVKEFKNHHLAKGSLMADWAAAWRKWVLNDEKFGGGGGNGYQRVEYYTKADGTRGIVNRG